MLELGVTYNPIPFTLNYKPTRGGRKFYRTSVPLHWVIIPVHTVPWGVDLSYTLNATTSN
jgi:hypothetical protein